MAERLGDRPRRVIADLVAIAAAIGLDEVEPLILGLEGFGDAVAFVAGAGEAALVRHLDHRRPVDCRVILRRRGEIWRNHCGEVKGLAKLGRNLFRIDKTVAAHPDAVIRLRQIGDDIATAFVGDHDLGEAGAEIPGLGDDPDPSLRPETAGDDPAD
jgi:hypothetical protein